MSMEQVIDLSIQWGPTILFALIVLAGFLTGIRRGFRKSLLLALNALIAFVLVFLAYIWLVTNPNVDEYVVKYSNEVLAMLGQSNIQTLLGASDSANSLKEILTEIIPQKMSLGEGIAAVIEENGAYLGALVNSAYRLVFAVILGIVYLVLVFIFFIFYLIFFSERRYKKKKEKKYINCVGAGYKKRRLLGGLVGSLRSVVSGLVFLSFFGTLLFITTGGDGSNESVDVNFGDEKIDEYYDIYEAVSEYGNYGIFSLLNSLKDQNNVPYYLYAADLVLSGSYEDRENNVNAEVVYRKEFACYVKFVKATTELLMKYGADDITPILNGADGDITKALTNTFAKEGFEEEFGVIIDEFEGDTFFINFALSAVDSIARNINDLNIEGIPQTARDFLSVLFTGEDAITVSNIVNKEDAKILLSSVISFIATSQEKDTDNTLQKISIIKEMLPKVTQLSIFKDEEKRAKGNQVLMKVYDYIVNELSKSDDEQEVKKVITTNEIMKLSNRSYNEIDWMTELADLINVGVDVLTLYENNYDEEDITSKLLHMLDQDNPNKEANKTALDNIINKLSKSEVLGVALSTSYVNDMLTSLVSSLAENIILPTEVDYVRKFNSDGSVKTDGEIYTLLTSLELMLENGFADFYDKMKSEEGFESQTAQFSELADLLLKEVEVDGKTTSVIDTLLNSKLLKYTLSQVLSSVNAGDFEIVIPSSCQENVSEDVVIINNETLKSLVSNISLLLPEEGEEMINIAKIYNNRNEILDNQILHASIIVFFVNTFESEDESSTIIIPAEYKTTKDELVNAYENNIWVSTTEVKLILEALNAIFDLQTLDVNNIQLDSIKISKESVSTVILSQILHATVSDIVIDTLEQTQIEVPQEAKSGDYISKTEITNLVQALEVILNAPEDGIQVNNFNIETISLKSSDINTLFESKIIQRKVTEEVNKAFDKPFVDQIYVDNTRKDIKKEEATSLLAALETILSSDDNGIDFNNINVANIELTSEKIEVAYSSLIFAQIVSDNILNNESIAGNIPQAAISSTNYTITNKDTLEQTSVSIIDKEETMNLVKSIETLFNKPLSSETSFDINSATISYGSNGVKGNLMTILGSKIVECLISDTIIDTLNQIPTECLSEVDMYNSQTKANVISKTELGTLIQIIGSVNSNDSDIYEISVGGNMNFEGFDRNKIEFLKSSSIARYKVSEILLSQNDLVIPVEALEEIKILDSLTPVKVFTKDGAEKGEFSKFLDALNAVIPTDGNFNNISVQMPKSKQEYEVVADSDVLRATITSKLEINNCTIFLDGDLDLTSYSNGVSPIPVLSKSETIKALNAVAAINGDNSNQFTASITIETLKTFDTETLDSLLSFNMVRYQVYELLVPVVGSMLESESVYIYTIVDDNAIKSDDLVNVYTKQAITNFLSI